MPGKDVTVPFYKLRIKDRKAVIDRMNEFTEGDPSRLTSEIVKSAFKSLIGSDSDIVAVPIVVSNGLGTTFRIPVKKQNVPVFVSFEKLQSLL